MTAHRIAGYGSWSSPITSDFVVAEVIGLADLRIVGGAIYWIEARPMENGRNVLVRRRTDGTIEDVTPAPYNVRTRVHEYGGAAYVIAGDTVFFSNFAAQRLYRLDPGGAPQPFSTRGGTRYADGRFDAARSRLVLVREDHGGPGAEPVNTIVCLPSTRASAAQRGKPALVDGDIGVAPSPARPPRVSRRQARLRLCAAHQRVERILDEFSQHDACRDSGSRAGVVQRDSAGGCRHCCRQPRHFLDFASAQHRAPAGSNAACGLDQVGKVGVPRHQRAGEAQRHRPERKIVRDNDPRESSRLSWQAHNGSIASAAERSSADTRQAASEASLVRSVAASISGLDPSGRPSRDGGNNVICRTGTLVMDRPPPLCAGNQNLSACAKRRYRRLRSGTSAPLRDVLPGGAAGLSPYQQ